MHMVAGPNRKMQSVLKLSMALTAAYVLATFYFGMRAHSLALISEAGHNVCDLLAILLSFAAVYFQTRPATDQKTFGYQRAGVLAAFVNAVTLIVLAAWIAFSAIHRLYAPVTVQPRLMMYVAAAGVLMNGAIAGLLWKFSGDVNIRSVFLHMLGDTLSTAAVIAGGAAILFTGIMWIDPALSLLIAGMIIWSSVTIVRETLNILLEGTPSAVSLAQVRTAIAPSLASSTSTIFTSGHSAPPPTPSPATSVSRRCPSPSAPPFSTPSTAPSATVSTSPTPPSSSKSAAAKPPTAAPPRPRSKP